MSKKILLRQLCSGVFSEGRFAICAQMSLRKNHQKRGKEIVKSA